MRLSVKCHDLFRYYCDDRVEVAVHGRGFVTVSTLLCRVGGQTVGATLIDSETLTCALTASAPTITGPDYTDVDIEVSLDNGGYWTRINADAAIQIPCRSTPAAPPSPP